MRFLTTLQRLVLMLLLFNLGEMLLAQETDIPAIPTIELDGSRFTDRLLTIKCETEGADIWYSFNQNNRARQYSAPIPLVQSLTLSTWSVLNGLSSDTLFVDIFAGEDPLEKPAIELISVIGKSRIVSVSSPDKGVSFEYVINEEVFEYNSPFAVSDTTIVAARSKYVDPFSDEVSYSEYSETTINAGSTIKLNPVVFMTNIHDLAKGETAVNMHSDVSDILLHPSVSIVYTDFTEMTMQSVPNDTTVIVHNTRLTAFAKADGYENSDTTFIDIALQSLEDVTAPFVMFQEAKSDGSRVFQVRNTAEGYPVPLVYYYTEGVSEPKAAVGNTVTIPKSEYGWVHFYAAADGYAPSPKVTYFVDSRTHYVEPYTAILPQDNSIPSTVGDLEFWNASELDIENYPTSAIRPSGNMYFHLKVHENFNDLVLPFSWSAEDNTVIDSKGNNLVLGEDFWLYEISTLISSENIASGKLDVTRVAPNTACMIRVKPSLAGEELIFKSTNSYSFQVIQTDFSDVLARTDFIIRANRRFQKVDVPYTVYQMNSTGTAYVKKTGATINPYTSILIAPFSFAYENDSIDLFYRPKFDYNPTPGSTLESLDHIDITLNKYPKIKLKDDAYLVGGSKKLFVYNSSGNTVATAQFDRLQNTSAGYRLVLNNTITNDGTYNISFPEGFFDIFQAVSSTEPFANSRAETLSYNIVSAFNPSSSPAEGYVEELQDITISFGNKAVSLTGDGEIMFNHNGNLLYTFNSSQVNCSGNKLYIHLPSKQTEGGSYQLVIPSGFFVVNGTMVYTKTITFNYHIEVSATTKYFENDTIFMINSSTLPDLLFQGWIRTEHENNEYEATSFNIRHHDPVNDTQSYKTLYCIKISNTPSTILNMNIAGVDSIVFYLANPAGWTYFTNFSGETEDEIFTVGATVPPGDSEHFGIRLNKNKEWALRSWGNNLANYLYAIKIITEMPPMGIESVQTDNDDTIIDLSGNPVESLIPNRIYIRNGKKFIYLN